LLDQQKTLTLSELEQAMAALRPEVLQMMPEEITRPTLEISAAQALYWSDTFADPKLFNPYHVHGYGSKARQLVEQFFQTPDAPAEDRRLIDRWAATLNLRGWYTWKPYQPPAGEQNTP